MFRKSAPEEPTVIGRGAVIHGTIRTRGRIQVDGQLEGTLEVDGQVSVGPGGSIVGEVIADEVAVGGRIDGKLTARKHLHVTSSGAVKGELRYGSLQIDRGAVLDGWTEHGERDGKRTAELDSERVPAVAAQAVSSS